jgi:thioredoxin-like negative regulator of GroEL
VHVRQHRVDESVTLLRTTMVLWTGVHPEHVEMLADLLAQHGRIAELEELAALPDCELAVDRLARWHAARGNSDTAWELLRPFVEDGWPHQATLLAEILTAAGRIDEAIAMARTPALAEPRYGADLFFQLAAEHGRHGEALAVIDEIAAGDGIPVALLPQWADFLRRSGRAEEALSVLLARPESDEPAARMGIAAMMRHLDRSDEAIALLTPPRNHAEFAELADILIRRGRADEALDAMDTMYAPRTGPRFIPPRRRRGRPEPSPP